MSEKSSENNILHILARGIILDNDFLLVAKDRNADNTFLPGGHLEFNENLKNALNREILEETGVNCIVNDYIGCIENQWSYNNIMHHEINHIFMVNGINKNMEIYSKENHLDIYWIKINDMDKENLLPHSARDIIKDIYNNEISIHYMS